MSKNGKKRKAGTWGSRVQLKEVEKETRDEVNEGTMTHFFAVIDRQRQ